MMRCTGIRRTNIAIAAVAILGLAGCGQDHTFKNDVEGNRFLAERDVCYDWAAKGLASQFGPAIERCDQAAAKAAEAVEVAADRAFKVAVDRCLAQKLPDDAALNRCIEGDGKWVRTFNAGWQEVAETTK